MVQFENISESQLHDILQNMLTIAVNYLGSFDCEPDIIQSVQDLASAISRDPKENWSKCIPDILVPISH